MRWCVWWGTVIALVTGTPTMQWSCPGSPAVRGLVGKTTNQRAAVAQKRGSLGKDGWPSKIGNVILIITIAHNPLPQKHMIQTEKVKL